MSENEKKFLEELTMLLASYAIDEVVCEERNGTKFIVFYSESSHLAFRLFNSGKYFDLLSYISEYVTQYGSPV